MVTVGGVNCASTKRISQPQRRIIPQGSILRPCLLSEKGEKKLCFLFPFESLAGDPSPLPAEDRYSLTWEAAVERLFDAAEAGCQ